MPNVISSPTSMAADSFVVAWEHQWDGWHSLIIAERRMTVQIGKIRTGSYGPCDHFYKLAVRARVNWRWRMHRHVGRARRSEAERSLRFAEIVCSRWRRWGWWRKTKLATKNRAFDLVHDSLTVRYDDCSARTCIYCKVVAIRARRSNIWLRLCPTMLRWLLSGAKTVRQRLTMMVLMRVLL